MFTGFASENTPAIQLWDFFRPFANTSAVNSVSLVDDCAPIQFFRTGANATAIQVYLPSAPIEGKQIKIVNQPYASSNQTLQIRSSDNGGNGTTGIPFTVGPGASITLVYCKNAITYGTTSGNNQTGWLSLDFGSPSAANFNAVVLGNPSNIASVNSSAVLGGTSNTSSGSYAAVVGGQSSTASGSNSAVMGGFNNTASGLRSAVIGGTTNQATQQYAATIGGDTIRATGSYAFAGGGSVNNAQGQYCSVVGGNSNTANGVSAGIFAGESNNTNADQAVVCGGSYNTANGNSSSVLGGLRGTTRLIQGYTVLPASSAPIAGVAGVSQSATLLLGRQTTDATATTLTSTTAAASTTNQVILPNNSAYTFQGTVIAARTAAGDTSSWKFEGAIKRGATAASTTLVAAVTPTVIAQDAGASAWVVAVTADTTNGGIAVTVTGAAATTIRWVCKIGTTEVTF